MIPYYIIPGLKNRKVKFNRLERVDEVINKVCLHFGITVKQLKAHRRHREIVEARYVCWYLLFNVVHITKQQTAHVFDLNHTTVLHGIKKAMDLMYSDPLFRGHIDSIESLLT